MKTLIVCLSKTLFLILDSWLLKASRKESSWWPDVLSFRSSSREGTTGSRVTRTGGSFADSQKSGPLKTSMTSWAKAQSGLSGPVSDTFFFCFLFLGKMNDCCFEVKIVRTAHRTTFEITEWLLCKEMSAFFSELAWGIFHCLKAALKGSVQVCPLW